MSTLGLTLRPKLIVSALCFLLSAVATPGAADELRLRAEIWNFYQWNADDSAQNNLTLRLYQEVALGGGWSVTFREEMPLLLTDKVGTENPTGEWTSGLGDMFIQGVLSTPEILPGTRLQAGLRVVFPTGQKSPFSNSSYQLGPQVGVSHHIEGIAGGLLLAPKARYLMSVAETQKNAKQVRKLQVYPHIALTLSESWYLEFWQDEPIVYDHEANEWFVPFDTTLSYRFARGAEIKFGGAVNLTENTTQYRHMVYGALSFSF